MKLIKKSEKLLLQKMKDMEAIEDINLQEDPLEPLESPESIEAEKALLDLEYQELDYIPFRNHPLVQSVGNTGWQVSEIWKEIRLDNF
ncbi:hypothetical protein HCG51_05620 [Tolypothrix sp. PCC 7910]|uniref:hypothetical protein n=1 Tax=Tolypothrix sp. PCC 7910 TaxID=2099387 RepID=UPI0014277FA5|nr:hypothetical protein [Tolypothrix sp. PCC 7910]QIR36289.1 hypothetical protein HCG51_05620 [Tolypothrix sp. PCC 7910]